MIDDVTTAPTRDHLSALAGKQGRPVIDDVTTAPPAAPVLDSGALATLGAARAPKFLATRDPAGIPNIVPVLSLDAADERTVIFGEMMIWKTRRNLETDSRVSVIVLSADLSAWVIRGRFVEFQRTGPYVDRVMEGENIRYNAYGGIRSAGVIEVVQVARTPRLSQATILLDTLRCRWLGRRLSRGISTVRAMPVQVQEKFGRLRAAKAVAFLDPSGHPSSLPALPLVPADSGRLVLGGPSVRDINDLAYGAPIAAAVLTPEPIAYQVKGTFGGLRRAAGRHLAVMDIAEAYSASPPLPGQLLRPPQA